MKKVTEENPENRASGNETTKEKILNAAEALFVERGYEGVSVSDIAAKSETTKGHLYYYFKNKESLFEAVLDRHLTLQRQTLMKAAVAGADMKGSIHAALDAYIDFIERNPGFPRLIQREMCSHSKSIVKISDGMAPVQAWGAGVLAGLLPMSGPASSKHFLFSVYSMVLNYYTYASMLERMWGIDVWGEQALAERRAHLHIVLDMIIESFINNKPGAAA